MPTNKLSIIETLLKIIPDTNKKIFQRNHCVKHRHNIRFQSVYCTNDVLFFLRPQYWVLVLHEHSSSKYWMLMIIETYTVTDLSHIKPMFHFLPPWNLQKTIQFSKVLRGPKMKYWLNMDKWFLWASDIVLKASQCNLPLSIRNVIIRHWPKSNGKVNGFTWNTWKYTFDGPDICFLPSLKYLFSTHFCYTN